jgi:uncharacterized protein
MDHMVRTLVIPGYRGSGPGHWQDHFLRAEAGALLVEQDDWDRPVLADWLHRLEAALMEHPHNVLVGHSLGALLIAHLADRPAAAHVVGALMVAPADGARMARADAAFASFADMPTARLPFPSILVASRDDPYMSFATSRSFAASWGAALVDAGKAGHINIDSGHGHWPEAHVLAASLAGRAGDPRREAIPIGGPFPYQTVPYGAQFPARRQAQGV